MDRRIDGSEQMPQQPVPVTAVVKVTAFRYQVGAMVVIVIGQPIPGDGRVFVVREMEVQVEEQYPEKQAGLHEYGSFGNSSLGAVFVK